MSNPRPESAEPVSGGQNPGNPLLNRFYVASLTFLRARQLASGARPRVEPNGHRHVRVALLEVSAGLVSGESHVG